MTREEAVSIVLEAFRSRKLLLRTTNKVEDDIEILEAFDRMEEKE